MTSFSRIEQQIPSLTAILVLIITVCAFCLSFYNLQAAAPAEKRHVAKRGRGSNAAERIAAHYQHHPNTSITDAAVALGLHRSTISRHVKHLVSVGLVDNSHIKTK